MLYVMEKVMHCNDEEIWGERAALTYSLALSFPFVYAILYLDPEFGAPVYGLNSFDQLMLLCISTRNSGLLYMA